MLEVDNAASISTGISGDEKIYLDNTGDFMWQRCLWKPTTGQRRCQTSLAIKSQWSVPLTRLQQNTFILKHLEELARRRCSWKDFWSVFIIKRRLFNVTKSERCLKDFHGLGDFFLSHRVKAHPEPIRSSAGSLPLKMAFGCSFVSTSEHRAQSRAHTAIENIWSAVTECVSVHINILLIFWIFKDSALVLPHVNTFVNTISCLQ